MIKLSDIAGVKVVKSFKDLHRHISDELTKFHHATFRPVVKSTTPTKVGQNVAIRK